MSYSYSTSFGPSISDCQEVFKLNQYTPEQVVDAIFSSQGTRRTLSKEEFRKAFRAVFERNATNTKGLSIDALIDKIFASCVPDGSVINPEKLGKSIAIFTEKRESASNPIQSLYFVLDRDFKGTVSEDELQGVIREVRDPSTAEAIRSNFANFRELITNSNLSGGFQLNYWDLYLNRSHVVVQKLLEAQKQIYEKRFSTSPLRTSTSTTSDPLSRISVNPVSSSSHGTTAYVSVPAGTYGAVPNTTLSYTSSSPVKTTSNDYASLANKIQSTHVITGTHSVKVESSPYKVDDHLKKSFTLFEGGAAVRPDATTVKQVISQPQSPGYVFADAQGVHHANITGRGQDTFIEHRQTRGIGSFQEFLELRERLGFNLIGAHEAIIAIRQRIGHIAQLSLDEFLIVFTDIFRGKFHNYYEFIERLAQIFYFIDLNNNGTLEVVEILQAFIHLFGGTQDDKIKAVFHLFDLDGSGFLDQNEIYNLILNTIRLSQAGGAESRSEVSIEKIAFATTQDLFNTIDLNHDEKISIDEFLIWYQSSGGEIDTEELGKAREIREARKQELVKRGGVPPPKRDEAKAENEAIKKKLEQTGAFTRAIDNVRSLIPFQNIHIHVAVNLLIEKLPERTCNITQFVAYLKDLLTITKIEAEDKVSKVARTLFNALDDNKNGLLELPELVTGISLLCGGTQNEKLRAGFDLFDTNCDKVLSFQELCQFFRAFFKMMSSDTPYEKLANGDARAFGYALAVKAFEETKTPFEGGLQFDTLREWVQN